MLCAYLVQGTRVKNFLTRKDISMNTNSSMGSSGGGRWMGRGVGNSERNYVDATIPGKFPNDNRGGGKSQGETAGAGSIYAAVLNERPNVSNRRNQGPSRSPSRSGSTAIPVVSQRRRNTGKIG